MVSFKELLDDESIKKPTSVVDRVEETTSAQPSSPFEQPPLPDSAPITAGLRQPDQNKGFFGDIGTAVKRGVLQLPGMTAGVADIPAALYTGYRPFTRAAEVAGEVTGIQPGEAAKRAATEYSPALQQAQQEISQIWADPEAGAADIAKAYLQRPEIIASQITESLPSMIAGGLIGRGLAVAGRSVAGAEGLLAREVGQRMAIPVAAGVGEGVVTAGQIMSESEGENQRKIALSAIGAGLLTSVIGAGAGRVAQKLGLETAETLMAKGFDRAIRKELSLGKSVLDLSKRVAGGAVSESILQELPQSAQEAVFQNYAEGKPLWEGVNRAAVEGAIAGFAMGAGANTIPGRKASPQVTKDAASEQLLAGLIPDSTIKVVEGMATVVRETEAGPTTITAPVSAIAKTIAEGGNINDIVPEEIAPAAPPVIEEPPAPQKIFERLPDTKKDIGFRIRGIEYRYQPKEGQTKKDLIEGIEGKSDAASIQWLKRNAETVTPEVIEPPTVPGQRGQEMVPGQRLFEKLPETETDLRYRIRGEEFQFSPKEGQTKKDLLEGVEGKSDAAAIGWLRRNAEMQIPARPPVAEEVARPPVAAEEVAAEEVAAEEVAAEEVAARPPVAEEVAARPPVAEEVARPPVAEEVARPPVAEEVARPPVAEEVARPPVAAEEVARPPVAEEIIAPESESVALAAAGQPTIQVPDKPVPGPGEINTVTGEPTSPKETEERDQIVARETIEKVAPADEIPITTKMTAAADEPTRLYATRKEEIQKFLDDEGLTVEDLPAEWELLTVSKATKEGKDFLGEGFDNLVTEGRIEIVDSPQELLKKAPELIKDKNIDRTGAVYLPKRRKILVVAGNLMIGETKDVLRHELTHVLLREDKKFEKDKDKILEDFEDLRVTDDSVYDAFRRVTVNTPSDLRIEEALAYWIQQEKNQKHSLFKRIISAVKAALRRLRIPTTDLTTTDIARMFSKGTQAWVRGDYEAVFPKDGDALYAMVDSRLKTAENKINKAAKSLANPKAKGREFYVQHAPKWLAVTPLRTLEQTFGKKIPQIKSFARHLDSVVSAKTDIVDTAAVKHDTAERAAKAGVGVDIFNRAAAVATYNQMIPWEDIYNQDWVPSKGTPGDRLEAAQKKWKALGMQKSTGLTFSQAYDQSKKAYNALKSKKLKNAYIDIVDNLSEIRKRERNNLLAYIEKVSEEGTDLRNNLMSQFNASFKNIRGAYWPLARFGDFILEYVNSAGERVSQSFPTISERNAAKATAIESGVDPANIKEDFKDKQPKGAFAIPSELMGQLSSAVEEKYLERVDPEDAGAVSIAKQVAQDTINDMNQIWLRWQPETAAIKNAIKRKNVKGFSEDMLRSYLDYVQRHGSSIAWSEQGRKIDDDINSLSESIAEKKKTPGADVTMDRHILNDLRNRINALKTAKVGPVASALGKLGTAYYMTSPSIALVQMSQLGALTYPNLATKYGPAKAAKALSKGVSEAFTKRFTRNAMFSDPQVNNIYENMRSTVTDENRETPLAGGKNIGDRLYSDDQILQQINTLTPYQKQLLTLRESMARNLLDISAAHEAYELTRGENPNSLRSRAFNLAMLPMSLSELTSRKSAILSTQKLSENQGKNFFETMSDISDVVNDTLYSYSKEGKGHALQGGLSRVLLQFQHYRIMTGIRMALLFKDAIRGESPEVRKAATKEFIGIMGMTGALAGSLGLPFSQTIFAILNTVLGDEDEPEDFQLVYENWLRENFGEPAAGVAARGLPTLLGADISRRIGLADIYGIQNEPPTGMHGRDLAAWWATSQLGPVFSVGQSWSQGYDEMVRKGNYLKGLEVASPKPIRDALKAYRVATEGLKTGAGKKIMDDSQIGPDEVVMLALGFNADEVSRAQTAERSLRKLSTKISERRGRLIRDAAKAITEGEGREEAMAAIRKFNKAMPRFAVTGRDVRPAVRRLIRGEYGATGVRERAVAKQYGVPVYQKQDARSSLGELLGR